MVELASNFYSLILRLVHCWQFMLVIYLLVARVIAPIFNKKIASDEYKARNLVMQYFLAASLAVCAASAYQDKLIIDWKSCTIAFIGVFNAFACYAYWQAIDVKGGLSKTSIFTQGDDLITLSLGFLILGEAKFVSTNLCIGILLCAVSAALIGYSRWNSSKHLTEEEKKKEEKKKNGCWALWIATYSVIWGSMVFSMRYFALQGVSVLSYATAIYVGSFFGAQIIYWLNEWKRDKSVEVPEFSEDNLKAVIRTVVCIYGSLLLNVWLRHLAPISAIQPIDQVAEMIFPTMIGLYYFKEIKQLDFISKIAMLVGLAGGLLIAFSY